jgi:uncharacterized protein YegL
VNYIIDASGSMSGIQNQVRSGFEEYVNELKKNAEGDVFLTLTTFDTSERTAYVARPIAEVGALGRDYTIGGMTALYDAIANTIKRVQDQVDADTKVITVIMTDGFENSSRENTEKEVNALITAKQDEGNWTFVFLGADQDAWATALRLGVHAGNTMSYVGSNTSGAMANVATATVSATRSAERSTSSYFADAGQSDADYDATSVVEPKSKLWTPDSDSGDENKES